MEESVEYDIRVIMIGLDMFVFKVKKGNNPWDGKEVMYWRKANQIHKWFVENCANGNYDATAEGVKITIGDLKKLKKLLQELLKNKSSEEAEEKMPTQSGFFFGGIGYDVYYWKSCEDTIAQIDKVIIQKEYDEEDIDTIFDGGYELFYCASW